MLWRQPSAGGNAARSFDPEPHVPAARYYLIAALAFVLGALVIASPWLSGVLTIPWDAKAQAYPQLVFMAHAFAAGDSPFWAPNVFAGHPQIADPQSLIFSPPFLVLALLNSEPSFRAADATVFAMLILAGLAVIGFFRDRGWHPAGAIVAAFAFSFGGSAAWRIQHVGEVLSLCWFAVSLFLLERALKRSSARYGFASGIVAGFMVLGRDQIAFLCTFVLAVFTLWHLLDGTDRVERLLRALRPLFAGLVAGVLTIAIPIALTLALAEHSNRAMIDYASAARGSLPPLALLSAVVSNLYGVDGPLKDFWGPPSSLIWGATDLVLARNMTALYFGAIPLAAFFCAGLAGAALCERAVRFFAVMAGVMLLYAIGRYTPLFRLAFAIPGVDLYRRPADATFPLCGLTAILSGYCLHALIGRGRMGRAWLGAAVVAMLFAACVYVAWDKDRLLQAEGPLEIGAISLGIAVLAVLAAPFAIRRFPALSLMVLAALMTGDIAVSNKPNQSTAAAPAVYDVLRPDTANETLALIRADIAAHKGPDRRDRVELAAVDYSWPNAGLVHGFDHDLGFNPVRLKLFTDATNAQDQIADPDQRTFSPLYPHFNSPLADLLGVRLMLSRFPLTRMDSAFKPEDFRLVAQTSAAYIWENPRALPRVMMPGSAQGADFDELLAKGDWPQIDFTKTVLLERGSATDASSHPAGQVRFIEYRNTEVVVDAQSSEGGYVVLNDIWHPWWYADIDGAPAAILRANVMFRAVQVPAGHHHVRFRFRPLLGLWDQMHGN